MAHVWQLFQLVYNAEASKLSYINNLACSNRHASVLFICIPHVPISVKFKNILDLCNTTLIR